MFWCLDFFRFLNLYICGMRYQGSVPSLNMKFIYVFTDTLYTNTKGKLIEFKIILFIKQDYVVCPCLGCKPSPELRKCLFPLVAL